MSEIQKYLPLLRLIAGATPYKRKKLLLAADDNFLKILIECCYNTLEGNVQLSEQKIKKLKKYKNDIRKIAKATKSVKGKRKILVQSGGAFLPIILPSIISALIALLKE